MCFNTCKYNYLLVFNRTGGWIKSSLHHQCCKVLYCIPNHLNQKNLSFLATSQKFSHRMNWKTCTLRLLMSAILVSFKQMFKKFQNFKVKPHERTNYRNTKNKCNSVEMKLAKFDLDVVVARVCVKRKWEKRSEASKRLLSFSYDAT